MSDDMNQVPILLTIISIVTVLFAVLALAMNYMAIGCAIIVIGSVILASVYFSFRYNEKVSGNYVELSFK